MSNGATFAFRFRSEGEQWHQITVTAGPFRGWVRRLFDWLRGKGYQVEPFSIYIDGPEMFAGDIADIRMYKRVIAPNEVAVITADSWLKPKTRKDE